MTYRIVVISDTQIPYHNRRQVDAVVKFIGDEQPDEVIHIGDLMDYPQPARWSKDSRAEFEGSVKRDSEAGKVFLGSVRRVYGGHIGVLEGNHDLRPRTYFAKYAPALDEYNPFDIDQLLDFDSHGVTLLPPFYEFHKGWVATHGHLGFSLSRYAGGTAMNAARSIGSSLICGHTHRAGIISESIGHSGKVVTTTGVEVGHMMDMRKAHYLKRGAGNWQSAFGIVDIDGPRVMPMIVPMRQDGSFLVDKVRRDAA